LHIASFIIIMYKLVDVLDSRVLLME